MDVIEITIKTTIQTLFDKGLLHLFASVEEAHEDYITFFRDTRRGDVGFEEAKGIFSLIFV